MTYSRDLRKQVLKSIDNGMGTREASRFYGISLNAIMQWKRNGIETKKRQSRPLKINDEALRRDVELYPDAYQYERAQRLGVSPNTVGYALRRLKISVKKRPTRTPNKSQNKDNNTI